MPEEENTYIHTDYDGDTLRVIQGLQGVVVKAKDHEDGDRTEVAVHTEELPRLIAALQAMHKELSS